MILMEYLSRASTVASDTVAMLYQHCPPLLNCSPS